MKMKLEKNEYWQDGLIFCSICKTQKSIINPNNGELIRCACNCETNKLKADKKIEYEQQQKSKRELQRKKAIPIELFRSFTFDNADIEESKNIIIAQRYVDKFEELSKDGLGLILWGNTGTGKTFTAMCIANALFSAGRQIRCTSFAEVVSLARDWNNARNHFDDLMKNECIIIDDLGSEIEDCNKSTTAFTVQEIFKFVDNCNVRNIPIIATTNLSIEELTKTAENTDNLNYARVYSRLLEKCYPIKINGKKFRTENQNQNIEKIAKTLKLKE